MNAITNYFDRHAPQWDGHQKEKDAPVIEEILDRMGLSPADEVLDVASGTGVIIPFLLRRGIKKLTATDLSAKMSEIFRNKFPGVPMVTANYEKRSFPAATFSKIVIFNAFPHFEDEKAVFGNSFYYLKPGGKLLIAHSMNREHLDEHHRTGGIEVQDHVLISDKEFRRLYEEAGFSGITVEDKKYFFSSGIRQQ
ncbi:MAG: methyltransferase domain-containing protein [Elusimicrobia bacterium]|nr:methyltransferase domain-containing protein [Elusimicrobiota bacterium]